MNFEAELKKLLDAEDPPPLDQLAELAKAQIGVLDSINKAGAGISLQVEEVYDIVKEADENARGLKSAAKRESLLLGGMIAVNDLLDSVLQFLRSSGAEHAAAVEAKREEALIACGLEMYDGLGQRLEPRLHTVASAEYSEAPPETVIRSLETGYAFRGNVIRKATVIISMGSENA